MKVDFNSIKVSVIKKEFSHLISAFCIFYFGLGAFNAFGANVICDQAAEIRSLEDPTVITATLSAKTAVVLESSEEIELDGLLYSKISWPEGEGWVLANQICEEKPLPPPVLNRKIIVNLTENRLYYYENGSLIDSWSVGTARYGKVTPVGEFRILEKEKCPPYFGSKGDHNTPGCIPANPFGPRVLWFIGHLYGIHGTNEPWLLGASSTSSSRRVSGGCVRNPNEKILWLFERVKVGDKIVITR